MTQTTKIAKETSESAVAGLDRGPRRAELYLAIATFALPLAVYLGTMAKGLVWGDGIELAAVAATLAIAHPTGYPLFTVLGHGFTWIPIGSEYWRVTLLCAVSMAACAVISYRWIRAAGDMRWAEAFPSPVSRGFLAVAGALTFAWARAPWSHATITEVYALQVLFQVAIAALALRVIRTGSTRAFLLVVFLFALSLTHHLLSVVLTPLVAGAAIALVRRWRRENQPVGARVRRLTLLTVCVFVLGLLPLAYLPIRASQSPALNWGDPSSWDRFVWVVSGGEFRGFRFLMEEPGRPFTVETYWSFFFTRAIQLGRYLTGQVFAPSEMDNPLWNVLALAGGVCLAFGFRVWWRVSRLFTCALLATVGLLLFFVFTYNIADIQDYELGLLGLLWPVGWVGLTEVARWGALEWRRAGESARASRLALLALAIPVAGCLFNYRASDRSGDAVADRYAVALLNELPADSLLVTAGDYDIYSAWYLQEVEGFRTDVLVYGSNFILSPWYEKYFTPETLRGRRVGTLDAPPTSDVAFVEALARLVIEPNLAATPIFTTLNIPALQARYRLEPVGQLLTEEEYATRMQRGLPPPPPILYRIAGRLE